MAASVGHLAAVGFMRLMRWDGNDGRIVGSDIIRLGIGFGTATRFSIATGSWMVLITGL